MNNKEALSILELNQDQESITIETIRKRYLKLCLKYHPDKNTENTASAKFQQINEAYLILLNYYDEKDIIDDDDYIDEFKDQYQEIWGTENTFSKLIPKWVFPIILTINNLQGNPIFKTLIEQLEKRIFKWIDSLDKEVLLNIYGFIKKLPKGGIAMETIEKMLKDIIHAKSLGDKHIKLEPELKDLFACNVIRHIEFDENNQEHVYMIPTWMEESVFDLNSLEKPSELIITCIPKCPLGVYLDNQRNVNINVKYNIDYLWKNIDEIINIEICIGYTISFSIKELYLRKYQILIFRGKGIPKGNMKDVFDVSMRTDIIIHIELL